MRGSSFFDGIRQVESTVIGRPARAPAFYYDSSSMTALFPARFSALRALMPDPSYVPARIAPGVGVVGVTCSENRDTDFGPYNLAGIIVVLSAPPAGGVPGRWLWRSLRGGESHIFVLHMPENSELPVVTGIEYLGYPKFVAAVDFADEGDRRICRVSEGDEHLLTMSGRRLPATNEATIRQFTHTWMDGQAQSHETRIHQHQVAVSVRGADVDLQLGPHLIARELDRLLLSRRQLLYEYEASSEMIVFLAEHLTAVYFKTLSEAVQRGSVAEPEHDDRTGAAAVGVRR